MRNVGCFIAGLFFSGLVFVNHSQAADASAKWPSCECENSKCGPCETETGVTFYSGKCGPNEARVKSCKKPTCVPVEEQPACFAKLGLPVPGAAAKSEAAAQTREPSSRVSREAVVAGKIINISGIASLIRGTGPVEKPREGLTVYVGDRVETKADGKVKIELKDQSEMIVAANSNVRIENVNVNEESKTRQITLNLITGKVRARVQKKLEAGNEFKVKTRTAVAGVRGTDFVASFNPGEKEWVSEVRTFEGLVHLENVQKQAPGLPSALPSKSVDIPAGTYASLVIGPPARTDDEEEFFKSIEAGFVSPVMKMKEDEARELNETTDFVAPVAKTEEPLGRQVASVNPDEICQAPLGRLKQCSFSCEGNPSGEKKCRTDLEGVQCVRRICSANGKWTEATRLPASEATQCLNAHPVVKDCGAYW